MTRSPKGFVKTAARGSAYSSRDGHWIVKSKGKWHLVWFEDAWEKKTLGTFATLAEAGIFYNENVRKDK